MSLATSTAEWSFELAGPEDDADIRRLLASSPIPGRVTVTYEREPSYFLGCGTMGRFCQVVVVRHQPGGELAGIGCRATRQMFVNGRPEEVGYLGQLRVDRRFRGRWLVSRAFRFLRQLDADGRVEGYVTTIVEDNHIARGLLVDRARGHFPAYRAVDTLWTLALAVRPARVRPLPPGAEIHRGSEADLRDIVAFLRQQGSTKQFYPAYSEADFRAGQATPGFRLEDFVVLRDHGAIVGVMGLWDQSAYKQTVIQAYAGVLRWARPWYNLAAPVVRMPPLPSPGQHIRSAYASFICVADNDPDIFRVLLRHVYRLAAERRYHYLLVGLTAGDPLLPVARAYPSISYPSCLYTVCWREASSFHERLDGRIPYVEIAAL